MNDMAQRYAMRRKRENKAIQEAHGALADNSQIMHWCMALLLEHGGINSLVTRGQLLDVELARNLGLHFNVEDGEIIEEREVRTELALRYKNLRKIRAHQLSLPHEFQHNVSALCQVLG
ncbi:MAG TPA: hypothetical protein ENO09_01615, partial [bacterium]|nr:hypothetical protein [bacterium]